jgi:hypothetical protein
VVFPSSLASSFFSRRIVLCKIRLYSGEPCFRNRIRLGILSYSLHARCDEVSTKRKNAKEITPEGKSATLRKMFARALDPFTMMRLEKSIFQSNIPVEDVSAEEFDSYLRGRLQLHRRFSEMYEAGYDRTKPLSSQTEESLRRDKDVFHLLEVTQWIFSHLYQKNTEKATALLSVFTLLHPSLLMTMLTWSRSGFILMHDRDVIRDGVTVTSWVKGGRTELFQLLLQRYISSEWSFLVDGIVEGEIGSSGACDILELLLEAGFKPTWNILCAAISRSKIDIINILLTHGMSLSAPELLEEWGNYSSPLSVALMTRNISVVRTLLMYGADPRAVDYKGITVIMNAFTASSSEECLLEILDCGVDTSICNQYGDCPLFQSLSGKYSTKIVEAVIASGADVNYRDAVGNTPLRYVQGDDAKSKELRALLLSKGATDLGNAGKPEANRWFLHESMTDIFVEEETEEADEEADE